MERNARQGPDRDQSVAPLPPERAFVVQLRQPRAADGEIFTGRVEHVSSGEGVRFESAAELIAFIEKIGGHTTDRSRTTAPSPVEPRGVVPL